MFGESGGLRLGQFFAAVRAEERALGYGCAAVGAGAAGVDLGAQQVGAAVFTAPGIVTVAVGAVGAVERAATGDGGAIRGRARLKRADALGRLLGEDAAGQDEQLAGRRGARPRHRRLGRQRHLQRPSTKIRFTEVGKLFIDIDTKNALQREGNLISDQLLQMICRQHCLPASPLVGKK